MSYRYPGIKPFTQKDQEIFFGREKEIKELSELIQLEKLIVLYGQSGIGKSSLLQAGIAPKIESEWNFSPIWVRIGSYIPQFDQHASSFLTPRESFRFRISSGNQSDSFLYKITSSDDSLWFHAKNRYLTQPESKGFLIFIDQFEELFTWPEKDIWDFKHELAELLNLEMSSSFRQALQLSQKENRNILSHEELNLLYEDLTVKVVFGIRSDRLNLLNRLNDVLPDILRNCYELHPLSIQQGQDAIMRPAQLEGEFNSRKFSYSPQAVDSFLLYLSKDKEKDIEPFQLQILCQYVESYVEDSQDDYIELTDIGKLDQIYHNYYDGQIHSLGDEGTQQKARKLLEDGLIFEKDKRRLSLFEGVIVRDYGLTVSQLQRLCQTRLLRSELDSRGGLFYEISHDALVAPILEARKERSAIEARILKEQEFQRKQAEREQGLKKAWNRRIRLGGIILMSIALIAGIVAIFQNFQLRQTLSNISFWAGTQVDYAHEMIASLQFERAQLLLTQAAELDPQNQRIRDAFLEILYYYVEADQIDKAKEINTFNKFIHFSLPSTIHRSDSLQLFRQKFSQFVGEDKLQKLEKRYYPEMVPVAGGTFFMGSNDSLAHEQPIHQVSVGNFELGKTEVTVFQYSLFCQSSGKKMPPPPGWGYQGDNPVVFVSWLDAVAYTEWLSNRSGKKYRLPTEAEWEFAARGGEPGWESGYIFSGSNNPDSIGWYKAGTDSSEHEPSNSIINPNRTQAVGQKLANSLGLFDMSGNVWEWCADWYSADYYQYCVDKNLVQNPLGPEKGSLKVVRGGAWGSEAHFLRVSDRVRAVPERQLELLGFRVAADVIRGED